MHKFLSLVVAVAWAAFVVSGCTTRIIVAGPTGRVIDSGPLGSVKVTMTNNELAAVDIEKDGELFCQNVRTGQTCRDILTNYNNTSVNVTYVAIGRNPNGTPAGIATRRVMISRYSPRRPTKSVTWVISSLRAPR